MGELLLPPPKRPPAQPTPIPDTSCPVRAGTWDLAIPDQRAPALVGQTNVQIQNGPIHQPCYEECVWLIESLDGKTKECAQVVQAKATVALLRRLDFSAQAEKETPA